MARYPTASITGMDSSEDMVRAAHTAYRACPSKSPTSRRGKPPGPTTSSWRTRCCTGYGTMRRSCRAWCRLSQRAAAWPSRCPTTWRNRVICSCSRLPGTGRGPRSWPAPGRALGGRPYRLVLPTAAAPLLAGGRVAHDVSPSAPRHRRHRRMVQGHRLASLPLAAGSGGTGRIPLALSSGPGKGLSPRAGRLRAAAVSPPVPGGDSLRRRLECVVHKDGETG